jgi:para-aminobenzoate synthetase / 4-amino-4-deoxychorismate lyase
VIDATAPFVLLDDARASGAEPALLFRRPVEIVAAREPNEVRPALRRLRRAGERGLHAAGFLSYEAGHALEPKLAPLRAAPAPGEPPLLWFGMFDGGEQVADLPSRLADPASAWTSLPRPLVSREAFEAAVRAVKEHIAAGNVYQANLTFAAEVLTAGDPLAIYAQVRQRARGGHGALVFTGEHWILSFSPELFFTLEEGRLITRPMKGTAERRPDPAADAAAAEYLRCDPKQRAENLMIVDLLRNDLSRVSKAGTVKVPALFEIETYPTVHQMTSTVVSELEDGLGPVDAIEALFPCGSITGAPKIRAMQIIAETERRARGAYTGSIGRVAPDGRASFNVAIRTLTLRAGESRAVMGLGAGIVADSRADDEWRECLAKGAFLKGSDFDLIETMRFDPHEGIADLDRHLVRMKASAEALGFAFDRHAARNELQAATFRLREAKKVRLLLSTSGAIAVEARPLPAEPCGSVEVAVLRRPVSAEDFRLRHKTTDRLFYDEARAASGCFEALFVDEEGFLTEGSFTHIFVERDGTFVTPPASRGLLPGILRARMIERGEAVEADVALASLPAHFYIGNSLRGLIRAKRAS